MKSSLKVCCAVSVVSILSLVACTDKERSANTESSTTTTQTTQSNNETQNKEQELSREVTPQEAGIGANTAKRGEKEVQATQEVVTKKVETLNEKVPTVVTGSEKLDINRMKSEDLVALGLERGAADRLIQHRDQHGGFRSANDLAGIQGIDQAWLTKYRDRFAFIGAEEKSQAAGQAAPVEKTETTETTEVEKR